MILFFFYCVFDAENVCVSQIFCSFFTVFVANKTRFPRLFCFNYAEPNFSEVLHILDNKQNLDNTFPHQYKKYFPSAHTQHISLQELETAAAKPRGANAPLP